MAELKSIVVTGTDGSTEEYTHGLVAVITDSEYDEETEDETLTMSVGFLSLNKLQTQALIDVLQEQLDSFK